MGGTISMGQAVQAAVGIGGTVMGSMAARDQAQYMGQLMQQGAGQRAMAQGIAEHFLGGGRASELDVPGFRDQFTSVDYALEDQLRGIETQARDARQEIAENVPSGGAKLRALAELSQKAQDAKAQAVREAHAKKRDLDIALTNQYTQQAMQGSYGVSPEAQLWAANQAYNQRLGDIGAISQSLGQLAGAWDGGRTQPPVSYESGVPGAGQGAQDVRRDYLESARMPSRWGAWNQTDWDEKAPF